MNKNQIIKTIQTRLGDKLWHRDFHGLDRAAKSALKKRIESGEYFGQFFRRLVDILEICGLDIVEASCECEENLNNNEGK
jgi:hypothetical protein